MPVTKVGDLRVNHMVINHAAEGVQTVILIHGLASNSAFWMPIANRLSDEARLVLYDLRGHGRSGMPIRGYTSRDMADDLALLMDALDIEDAVIGGHSFGGSVALEFLCAHPGRVKALMLMDARSRLLQPVQIPNQWPHWDEVKARLDHLHIDINGDEPDGGYRILTEFAKLVIKAHDAGESSPKWLTEFFGQSGSRFTAERWLKLLAVSTAWDDFRKVETFSVEQLQALHVPVSAIYGELSPVMPTADALREVWPGLAMHVLTGTGHFFPLTRPDALCMLFCDFLAELRRAPRQKEAT